jgi:hypothetical protein
MKNPHSGTSPKPHSSFNPHLYNPHLVGPAITLWKTNSSLLKMAIEIVDLHSKNGDVPVRKL